MPLVLPSSTLIGISLPMWQQILHINLHINETQQQRTMQIVTEYFVDEEKYFYLILLHRNIVICIGAIMLTATGTTLAGYIIYVCGIFRIAR